MSELFVVCKIKYGFWCRNKNKEQHKNRELRQTRISSHIQDSVPRMVIYFDSAFFPHGYRFLVINQGLPHIPDLVSGFQNPGRPVPLFIIDKKFLREHANFIDYFPLYEHGATMGSIRRSGIIILSPVLFQASDSGCPSCKNIDGIEAGVLYHIGL